MFEEKLLYKDLSYKIVGLAMQVHTELGHGFLEKVYENALMVLFEENGIHAQEQIPIKVQFNGRVTGDYVADILVADSIILELKAQDRSSMFTRLKHSIIQRKQASGSLIC